MNFIEYCQELNNKKHLYFKSLFQNKLFENEMLQVIEQIQSNKPRQILWHILNDDYEVPLCKECNKFACGWHSDNRVYRPFCCGSCAAKASARDYKQYCIETKGVEHHMQLQSCQETRKQTNQRLFGKDYAGQNEEKIEQRKKTCQKKYGGNSPACSIKVQEKTKNTCQERYQCDYTSQIPESRDKAKIKILEVYGPEGLSSPIITERRKKTCQERYECASPAQNHWPDFTKDLVNNPEKLKEYIKDRSVVGVAKELGMTFNTLYQLIKKHNLKIVGNGFGMSSPQHELFVWLQFKNIPFVGPTRKIIRPKELDFYFPDKKIAIEFNGTYWHCDPRKYSPDYLNKKKKMTAQEIWDKDKIKLTLCQQQDILLIMIWEDDWETNKEQILNNLENIL